MVDIFGIVIKKLSSLGGSNQCDKLILDFLADKLTVLLLLPSMY